MLTLEEKIEQWETQRNIKNLMGKYANCIILNREHNIFELFWSKAEDTALGFNDGWYRGQDAIKAYYEACYDRNVLVAALMQRRFPKILGEKSPEDIYGIGPFKVKPMATPVIEVAGDGATAKGLWSCLGSYNDVESCGPLAHWTWGYFAADFIKENGKWKIWHLQYLNDVDCICGQSWGRPQHKPPELDAFAQLKDFQYPAYTERATLRKYYCPRRPHTLTPRIPEPYQTFSETFSYGE